MTREERIEAAIKAAEPQWDAKYGSWSQPRKGISSSTCWQRQPREPKPRRINPNNSFANELKQIRLQAKPRLS